MVTGAIICSSAMGDEADDGITSMILAKMGAKIPQILIVFIY